MDISHWSYRVVIEDYQMGDCEEHNATIREVYFDHSGNPVLWSSAISPYGYSEDYPEMSIEDLKQSLEMMNDAFNHEQYRVIKDGEDEHLEEI